MADFELATLDATNINFNDMTLNAELTALDSAYDSVILSFDYGLNSDLSSATTSVTSGIFAVNNADDILIDGLAEDTTYYFKAKGETVAYDSQGSMQNASTKDGWLKALSNNEVEMNKIVDLVTAVSELFSNLSSRTIFLSSSYIVGSLWESLIGSEQFWEIDSKSWGSGSQELWTTTINFDNLSSFNLEYFKNAHDSNDMFIKINGNTVWSSTNTDGVWYSDTIDVSNNSGELTVEIGTEEDPRSDYIWTLREQENSYALVIGSSSDHKISTMPTEVYGAFKNIELV